MFSTDKEWIPDSILNVSLDDKCILSGGVEAVTQYVTGAAAMETEADMENLDYVIDQLDGMEKRAIDVVFEDDNEAEYGSACRNTESSASSCSTSSSSSSSTSSFFPTSSSSSISSSSTSSTSSSASAPPMIISRNYFLKEKYDAPIMPTPRHPEDSKMLSAMNVMIEAGKGVLELVKDFKLHEKEDVDYDRQ
jgi:hypothetical protein